MWGTGRLRGSMSSVLALALEAGALGQVSTVPYAPGDGPSFASDLAVSTYRGSFSSIRAVDFRNLTVSGFPLRNGHAQSDEKFGHSSFDLESVYFIGESALVLYSYFAVGGSSTSEGRATVFNVFKHRLRSVQEISWETHGSGQTTTWSFNAAAKSLTIRSDHYRPGDAHCCISAVDVVTYKWEGSHFVPSDLQTQALP